MIRKAMLGDIKNINKLGILIHPDFENLFNIREELQDENKLILVNINNNELKGFLQVITLKNEIDIINIVVDINYRQKGAAKELMNYLFRMHRELNVKYFLEVAFSNQTAISLYYKLGFIKIGTRKKYYQEKDAWRMMKE